MRTAIVGGGPGGLYLSILLKRIDPAHDVVVFERNAPDDTFGFGVVFSDETLDAIEAADPPTLPEITDGFPAARRRDPRALRALVGDRRALPGGGGDLRRPRLLGARAPRPAQHPPA